MLDFSYTSRSQVSTLDELGRVLSNVVTIVPAGVVVFFPSYDYEQVVFHHLEKSGVMAKISARKAVFREERGKSSDHVLESYSKSIRLSGGAALFAVVGGKMSEGINFSDNLGR